MKRLAPAILAGLIGSAGSALASTVPTVEITWCGTWNQGGAVFGYADAGSNFTLHFLWKGFPLEADHGIRVELHTDGHVTGWRY